MILFPNGIQGLADTMWSGVRGAAYRLVGIDFRSEPGAIKAHQKLTKISASVVDQLCKVALPLSDGTRLWFSSESGKIWREVSGVFSLLGTLALPSYKYNLNTTKVTGKTFNYSTQVNIPTAHAFSADGLKMYVICNAKVSGNGGEIFQYTLTTAFDVSTATYASKTFAADQQAIGMWFKPDGTKFYVAEDDGSTSVIEYNLGTAWDISTASASGDTYDFSAQFIRAFGMFFKNDGTEMYLMDGSNQLVRQYTLGTAWDITTASYTAAFNPGTNSVTYAGGGFITSDGKNLLLSSTSNSATIKKYELTTPWDITTSVFRSEYVTGSSRFFGLIGSSNDNFFYVGTQNAETIYQYEVTNADADPKVTVLGAAEFAVPDGGDNEDEMTQYVYFATQNWLLRVAVTDVANITNVNDNNYVAQFLYGDDTYHRMKIANGRLFVTDKYTLLQVNEFGVITLESDLSVREPERITILENFDVDLLIGTKRLDEKSRILRWDTESPTWYGEDTIYEGEIHAFLDEDNYTYAIVGDFGQMNYYDGEKLLKYMRIPGLYSNAAKCKVNANSVGYFMGVPVFGLSNITGNPNLQGVYSFGQYTKDYKNTMDLSYPVSSNEFAGVEIGAIVIQGTNMYVAWKSATGVGIDQLDWSNKYNGGYIETMVLNNPEDRSKFKSTRNFLADYIEVPDSTSVTIQYSKNYANYATIAQKTDVKLLQLRAQHTIKEIGALQAKFIFNTSVNATPKIENFHVNFEGEL